MWRAEPVALALVVGLGCAPPAAMSAPALAAPPPPQPTVVIQPIAPPVSAPAPAAPAPVAASPSPSPNDRDAMIDKVLAGAGPALKAVLATPEKYRFQILYGAISAGAKPTLERHGYRADAEYFFPASSMKVPIALASYDRLAVLREGGKHVLARDATLRIHPVGPSGEPYVTTLARETWRALIVSDNFSANRLLGFVGHREAHETLWKLGLASTRIHTGFATGDAIDPAETSPRIEVADGAATYEIPARKSELVLPPTAATGLAIGTKSVVDGRIVPGPLSFADKNAIRLRDLQDTLVRIMRPELTAASAGDTASAEDLAYIREALGTLPSESGLAGFDRNVVADYQLSPLLRGIERVRPRGHFQIFSKVGQAFGFLIANAYVVDKDTGRAFFLTASIYANPDETMNDDKYAYDTIAFPALADVGEVFSREAFAR